MRPAMNGTTSITVNRRKTIRVQDYRSQESRSLSGRGRWDGGRRVCHSDVAITLGGSEVQTDAHLRGPDVPWLARNRGGLNHED